MLRAREKVALQTDDVHHMKCKNQDINRYNIFSSGQ